MCEAMSDSIIDHLEIDEARAKAWGIDPWVGSSDVARYYGPSSDKIIAAS
jgi:hypothetical protein